MSDRAAERRAVILLSILGLVWGILYGAIMNVFFWPYAMGPTTQTWEPGINLGESLSRYAAFYLVTSLGWDVVRGVGNVLLLLVLGVPVMRVLIRFRRRFYFEAHTLHD